jgi:hypothetical protein
MVLALLPVAYGVRQLHLACDGHAAAVVSFNATRTDAAEVQGLRGMAQRINDRQRPEQDMIARLHAAMQHAGIDVSRHFQALRLEGDVELSGDGQRGLRRQSVVVALGDLNLQQLGSLLVQWKADQPVWTLSRLEMTHARGSNSSVENDRYDIALTFSALYASAEGVGS